jgi:hypothetical protein
MTTSLAPTVVLVDGAGLVYSAAFGMTTYKTGSTRKAL